MQSTEQAPSPHAPARCSCARPAWALEADVCSSFERSIRCSCDEARDAPIAGAGRRLLAGPPFRLALQYAMHLRWQPMLWRLYAHCRRLSAARQWALLHPADGRLVNPWPRLVQAGSFRVQPRTVASLVGGAVAMPAPAAGPAAAPGSRWPSAPPWLTMPWWQSSAAASLAWSAPGSWRSEASARWCSTQVRGGGGGAPEGRPSARAARATRPACGGLIQPGTRYGVAIFFSCPAAGEHGVGGRLATRRAADDSLKGAAPGSELVFDHAAQYFTAADPAFIRMVERWEADGQSASTCRRLPCAAPWAPGPRDQGPQPTAPTDRLTDPPPPLLGRRGRASVDGRRGLARGRAFYVAPARDAATLRCHARHAVPCAVPSKTGIERRGQRRRE